METETDNTNTLDLTLNEIELIRQSLEHTIQNKLQIIDKIEFTDLKIILTKNIEKTQITLDKINLYYWSL